VDGGLGHDTVTIIHEKCSCIGHGCWLELIEKNLKRSGKKMRALNL
jgi:hypothetical protein